MSTSNFDPGYNRYHSSIGGEHFASLELTSINTPGDDSGVPTAGSGNAGDSQDPQQSDQHDHAASDGRYGCDQLGYGWDDTTYHVGGYGCSGLDTEVVPFSWMPQVTVASPVIGLQAFMEDFGTQNIPVYDVNSSDSAASQSQPLINASTSALKLSQHNSPNDSLDAAQGLEDFDQRHLDPTCGPILHASIQSSNSMCFRTERRTVNHRSAPYSIVYRQERSRGPIYNGNIFGGVQNFQISDVNGAVLESLKEHAATGAMHDSDERFPPPLCHPGTREAVIYRILDWYGYQHGPGKPIIPARFIITLAYQLFVSIPELAPHIGNAVKQNPIILRKALEVQLKTLIIEPFKALGDTTDMPNRLIIVDGLDECINSNRESRIDKQYAEDQETVQIRVLDLIRSLASHQLPLSFLILSRPEAWIKQHIESTPFKDLVEHVDLYEVGDHLKDVETYVKAELSRLGLGEEGLVTRLVRRANGHMLYASTVIRHIDCPYDDPRTRLENTLNDYSNSNPDLAHSAPFSSLYELYRQILRSCPEGNRSVMIDVLEEICEGSMYFGPGIGIHQAVGIFDHFAGRVPGAGMKAIRGLHAVLCSSSSSGEPMVRFFIHRSFHEFLFDPRTSHEFRIDQEKGARRLLRGCLHSLSLIRLRSKVDEDHVRFALVSWSTLFSEWSSLPEHRRPDTAEHRADVAEMCQKLLNIDLTACFIHTFTLDFAFRWTLKVSSCLCNDDDTNHIIAGAQSGIYESNTLVQRAISHVVTSHEAAVLHVLQRRTLIANPWCTYFPEAVYEHLWKLSSRPEGRDSDSVVHALKSLRQASWDLFDSLMADVEEISQEEEENALYDNDEGYRRYCALIALIRDNAGAAFYMTR
ncbi:hypothetical protein H1R20_g14471, partial [Candolleomyces eurysporus]